MLLAAALSDPALCDPASGHCANAEAHADCVHFSGEPASNVYCLRPFWHVPLLQQEHVQSW